MIIIALGDLHDKVDIIENLKRQISQTQPDVIVLLGDYVDDWTTKGLESLRTVEALEELICWCGMNTNARIVYLCGNHDLQYLTDSYCTGTQRLHAIDIKCALRRLPLRAAYAPNGSVLFTHAGVTRAWLAKHGIDEEADAVKVADAINDEFDFAPLRLNIAGAARGGTGIASPMWCDSRELLIDAPTHLIQVIGHDPVETVTQKGNILFCDTLSTMSDGTPIGDGTAALIDTDTLAIERMDVR